MLEKEKRDKKMRGKKTKKDLTGPTLLEISEYDKSGVDRLRKAQLYSRSVSEI